MNPLEQMLAERIAYRAKLEPMLLGFRNLQPLPHLSEDAQAEVTEDIQIITDQLKFINNSIELLEKLIKGLEEGDFPNLPNFKTSPAVLAELKKNDEANNAALGSLTAEALAAVASLASNPFTKAVPKNP